MGIKMTTKTARRAFNAYQVQQSEKRHALQLLGDNRNVYTILRRVSASGMTRAISLKIIKDGELIDITYTAARALGEKCVEVNGHNVIKVQGCGMDMGFHLVYNLASVLFAGQERAGYELKQRWI
jgi:hypothetical protein